VKFAVEFTAMVVCECPIFADSAEEAATIFDNIGKDIDDLVGVQVSACGADEICIDQIYDEDSNAYNSEGKPYGE
jgi:hypothetical protein